jgi:protocatechuate 3,4-dioxygenase beta subunit
VGRRPGLAAVVPACTSGGGSGGDAGGTEAGPAPDCVLMPELTEGPFYLDLDLVRSDIAEGRPGLALDLRVRVVDADACEPIEGAAVDLWHCDAERAYSGVQGVEGETDCRGIQLTDPEGVAEFRTIFPGGTQGEPCTST